MISQHLVTVHDRQYQLPKQPTVVICVDGFDPTYLETGIRDGILPNLACFVKGGFHVTARSAMPSLTNPNNLSIITGMPTRAHGISGNYYLDTETNQEHMILDDSLVRGTTILEQMANAGVRVAAITAKDKLRKIISRGLSPKKGSICFSTQFAGDCTANEHGITDVEKWIGRPAPSQYSGDLSIYVLDAGVKLLEEKRADLFYLTLSDFIQHKHAPGSTESNEFLQKVDQRVGELVKLGAVVAITGDHGMSDKSDANGEPNVLFLEDVLAAKWPEYGVRVICPITDPFVKHHGALGGLVRVYLTKKAQLESPAEMIDEMVRYCRTLPLVEAAFPGSIGAAILEMPADREGDFIVISNKNAVIGSRKDEHDLAGLKGHRLRSHGGLSEQEIPVIRSGPLNSEPDMGRPWRNYDVFDVALNY